MKTVDNFTIAYEPINGHCVFYTNGIGFFSGTWYQFDGVEIKPQAGDLTVEEVIFSDEVGFQRVGNVLSKLAKDNPDLLHQNGGQIWWDRQNTLKIRRLDDPGTDVEILGNGEYRIYEFRPEIH